MADTAIAITAGAGTNVDTRTEATNGNHRQVVVLGDPSTNAGVAAVDATAGLKVDLGADNDVVLGAGTAGIGKLTANSGVDIGDVDVTSVIPGSGATNLGKAEDAVHSSGDVGVMALGVRSDAGTLLAADGDYIPFSIDSGGALRVSGAGGGTQYTEDAAAAADPVGTVLMGIRRDTLVTNEVSADGDNVAIKATNKGQLHVLASIDSTQLGSLGQAAMAASAPVVIASNQTSIPITVASAGIASGAIASGAVASGAFASGALASGSVASGAIASGAIAAGAIAAGATSIADDEDVASAGGDRGVKTLAVRKLTPVNTSGTDGDYEFLQMSSGQLHVNAGHYQPGTNGWLATPFALIANTEAGSDTLGSGLHTIGATARSQTDTVGARYAEVYVIFGDAAGTPTAGGTITGWFQKSTDGGTTYEAISASTPSTTIPAMSRSPDFVIPIYEGAAANAAASIKFATGPVKLPTGTFKTVIQNNSGAALGNTTTTHLAIMCAPIA